MALYLKPVTGKISLKSLEKYAFKRLGFLIQLRSARGDAEKQHDVLCSAATAVDSDCLIEGSAKDNISHFILRLLLSRDAEMQEFFITGEVELLALRLSAMSGEDLAAFFLQLERKRQFGTEPARPFLAQHASTTEFLHLMLQLRPAGETWHSLVWKFLEGGGTIPIRLPWTAVAPMVAHRQVQLQAGMALIALSHLLTSVTHLYHGLLRAGVRQTRNAQRRMSPDPRMTSLARRLKSFWRGQYSKLPRPHLLRSLRRVEVDAAVQWFPPCMAHLHQQLRKLHRLHHHDRIQYTLFLKEAGMAVQDAVEFWCEEYSRPNDQGTSCGHDWSRDGRRYTYSIQHLYGLQGSRRLYRGHSCQSLQARTLGAQEHGGCPFVHFDQERLSQILSQDGATPAALERIFELKHRRRFSQACTFHLREKMACLGVRPRGREAEQDGAMPVSGDPSSHTCDPPCHTVDPPCHTGDPFCHTGDPPCHTGDPPCHTGDPPCHTGDLPCDTVDPPCHTGDPPCHTGDLPCHTVDPPCHTVDPPCHTGNPFCHTGDPICHTEAQSKKHCQQKAEHCSRTGVDCSQAGVNRSRTGVNRSRTGVDCCQAGVDCTWTGVDCSGIGVDCNVVVRNCSQARMDCGPSGVDCSQLGVDCGPSGVDCSQIGVDCSPSGVASEENGQNGAFSALGKPCGANADGRPRASCFSAGGKFQDCKPGESLPNSGSSMLERPGGREVEDDLRVEPTELAGTAWSSDTERRKSGTEVCSSSASLPAPSGSGPAAESHNVCTRMPSPRHDPVPECQGKGRTRLDASLTSISLTPSAFSATCLAKVEAEKPRAPASAFQRSYASIAPICDPLQQSGLFQCRSTSSIAPIGDPLQQSGLLQCPSTSPHVVPSEASSTCSANDLFERNKESGMNVHSPFPSRSSDSLSNCSMEDLFGGSPVSDRPRFHPALSTADSLSDGSTSDLFSSSDESDPMLRGPGEIFHEESAWGSSAEDLFKDSLVLEKTECSGSVPSDDSCTTLSSPDLFEEKQPSVSGQRLPDVSSLGSSLTGFAVGSSSGKDDASSRHAQSSQCLSCEGGVCEEDEMLTEFVSSSFKSDHSSRHTTYRSDQKKHDRDGRHILNTVSWRSMALDPSSNCSCVQNQHLENQCDAPSCKPFPSNCSRNNMTGNHIVCEDSPASEERRWPEQFCAREGRKDIGKFLSKSKGDNSAMYVSEREQELSPFEEVKDFGGINFRASSHTGELLTQRMQCKSDFTADSISSGGTICTSGNMMQGETREICRTLPPCNTFRSSVCVASCAYDTKGFLSDRTSLHAKNSFHAGSCSVQNEFSRVRDKRSRSDSCERTALTLSQAGCLEPQKRRKLFARHAAGESEKWTSVPDGVLTNASMPTLPHNSQRWVSVRGDVLSNVGVPTPLHSSERWASVAPRQKNESGATQEILASRQKNESSATQESLASRQRKESSAMKESLASRQRKESGTTQESLASRQRKESSATQESLALRQRKESSATQESLAPRQRRKSSATQESLASRQKNESSATQERLALRQRKESSATQESLAPRQRRKSSATQESLASRQKNESGATQESLASRQKNESSATQESLASRQRKESSATQESLALRQKNESSATQERLASRQRGESGATQERLASRQKNESSATPERLASRQKNESSATQENLASRQKNESSATPERLASRQKNESSATPERLASRQRGESGATKESQPPRQRGENGATQESLASRQRGESGATQERLASRQRKESGATQESLASRQGNESSATQERLASRQRKESGATQERLASRQRKESGATQERLASRQRKESSATQERLASRQRKESGATQESLAPRQREENGATQERLASRQRKESSATQESLAPRQREEGGSDASHCRRASAPEEMCQKGHHSGSLSKADCQTPTTSAESFHVSDHAGEQMGDKDGDARADREEEDFKLPVIQKPVDYYSSFLQLLQGLRK